MYVLAFLNLKLMTQTGSVILVDPQFFLSTMLTTKLSVRYLLMGKSTLSILLTVFSLICREHAQYVSRIYPSLILASLVAVVTQKFMLNVAESQILKIHFICSKANGNAIDA